MDQQKGGYQSVSPAHVQQYGNNIKQEAFVPGSSHKVLNRLHHNANLNQGSHVKTFSLPVDMPRTKIPVEVALPAGWSMAKTPTGQAYFINHVTQTTTWEDPRKMLLDHQNDNLNDGYRSLALPVGWTENKNGNGEVYFINHNSRSTQWEDPRIEIYMQQEHLKKIAYRKETECYSPSTSSLSSSGSSIQSLNNVHITSGNSTGTFVNKCSKDNQTVVKSSNKDVIRNLQQSLDQVLKQKSGVLKKLDSLSEQEMGLKSKLSQKDLDDVLRLLKNGNVGMDAFGRYGGQKMKSEDMDSTLVVGENNL